MGKQRRSWGPQGGGCTLIPCFCPRCRTLRSVGCAPLSPHIGVFWRSGLCLRLGTSLGRMGAWHSVRYDPVPLRLGAGGGYVHRRSVRARCGESIWGWGVTRGGRSPGTGILMGRRWIQCVKAVHCKGGRARRGAARNSTHSAGPHTAPPPSEARPRPQLSAPHPPPRPAGRGGAHRQRAAPSPLLATHWLRRPFVTVVFPPLLVRTAVRQRCGTASFPLAPEVETLGAAQRRPRSVPRRSAPLRAAPPARSPAPRRSAPRVR